MQWTGQKVMFDLRQPDLSPPAAHARRLLRQEPRRPPGHARHHRRGCAERNVHLGRGFDLRRSLRAGRHSRRHAVHELEAGADHLCRAAVDRRTRPRFSAIECAIPTGASASPSPASTPTCRSTSAAWSCCSSSIASARPTTLLRNQRSHMEAFKDAIMAYAVYYPVVEILSSIAIACVIWFGGDDVMRNIHREQRRREFQFGRRWSPSAWCRTIGSTGRAGRLHPVRAALLPSDHGLQREVQHPAIGDGRQRTHLQAAGYARGSDFARGHQKARRARPHRVRSRLVRVSRNAGSRQERGEVATRPCRQGRLASPPRMAMPPPPTGCCAT